MTGAPTLQDVVRARQRIASRIRHTPLVASEWLSRTARRGGPGFRPLQHTFCRSEDLGPRARQIAAGGEFRRQQGCKEPAYVPDTIAAHEDPL